MTDQLRRRKPGPRLLLGDCREQMKTLPDNSVDAIVTDVPYEIGLLRRSWDKSGIAYDPEVWTQCFRVLKPGGHVLSFMATRTYHRLAVAIEDAGFEIREMLGWLFLTGMPKSMDVSKAIDRMAGAERKVIGQKAGTKLAMNAGGDNDRSKVTLDVTAPATAEPQQWQGWGTALKPCYEPVCLARKPVSERNIALNVLKYGTGAMNIDASRVGDSGGTRLDVSIAGTRSGDAFYGSTLYGGGINNGAYGKPVDGLGRWPTTLLVEDHEEVWKALPPGAARFFLSAKASHADRGGDGNVHVSVKPVALMRYLCRLITPLGGVVLDPFMGSGSTIIAARMEGFRSIGIDLLEEHLDIVRGRLDGTLNMKDDEDDSPTPGAFF